MRVLSLILGVVVLVLLAVWITWTAMRIDRLHARVAAAWQSLAGGLAARSDALQDVLHSAGLPAGGGPPDPLPDAAPAPAWAHLSATITPERIVRENQVGAAIAELPDGACDERLHRACVQVQTARIFYNDAVRAYAALRSQRMPRLLRLGSSRAVPPFFDIDDSPGTAQLSGD